MKVKCALCGCQMKDKLPYSDPSELLGLCRDCEKIQDIFLERRVQEIKDKNLGRRKSDKPPKQ